MTITAIEATTALPYLGALAAIARADPSRLATVSLLLAYNLIFVAPPIILGLTARYGGSGILERLSTRREGGPGGGRTVLRVLCGLVGIVLLLDAGMYFLTDETLLPA